MTQIIKRADARRKNLRKYFTGKPCRNGHLAERYAESGMCVECNRIPRATPIKEFSVIVANKVAALRAKADELERNEAERVIAVKAQDEARAAKKQFFERYAMFKNTLSDPAQYEKVIEPVHPGDVQAAQSILLSHSLLRDMTITIDDLWPTQKPKSGVLYTFKCHVDDTLAIRNELKALYAKTPPVPRRRDAIPESISQIAPTMLSAQIVDYVEPSESIFDVPDPDFMA